MNRKELIQLQERAFWAWRGIIEQHPFNDIEAARFIQCALEFALLREQPTAGKREE